MLSIEGTSLAGSSGPETLLPPKDYQSIEEILAMDVGKYVNVFGLIKDFRTPVETRGTDWKCTFDIFDISTQDIDFSCKRGIQVTVFLPYPRMQTAILQDRITKGDVVVLRKVKTQRAPRQGINSLITSHATSFEILRRLQIPEWPSKAKNLSQALLCSHKSINLIQAEVNYIIWLNSMINTDGLPSTEEFQHSVAQSANRKEKFSLCKDLQDHTFYDLLVEIRRVHDDGGSQATIHVSDYTANSQFHLRERSTENDFVKQQLKSLMMEGDDYGYLREHTLKHSKSSVGDEWPGPYGKMSFQITAWGANADYFNENLKVGDWVELKNVQVRVGNAGHLEGRMSEDRQLYAGELRVSKVVYEGEDIDPRFKDAVRRKREYKKKLKNAEVRAKNEATRKDTINKEITESERRPNQRNVDAKSNGRKRRRHVMEETEREEIVVREKMESEADLNSRVRCTSQTIAAVPLSLMLSYRHNHVDPKQPNDVPMPFVNHKYRLNIRVVDYYPHDLRHFLVGHRTSEFDILSDNSSDSNTDDEGDMEQFRAGKGFGVPRMWKWRFALLVEDAKPDVGMNGGGRARAWIHVDNEAAQCLHDLDAASPSQEDVVMQLRKRMFILWGDLEEKKSAFLQTRYGKALLHSAETPREQRDRKRTYKTLDDLNDGSSEDDYCASYEVEQDHVSNTSQTPTSKRRRLARNGQAPPLDSDSDYDSQVKESEHSTTASLPTDRKTHGSLPAKNNTMERLPLAAIKSMDQSLALHLLESEVARLNISNKGFGACVRSYGVCVDDGANDEHEHDDHLDDVDASNDARGKRWERMFSMFGTRIVVGT